MLWENTELICCIFQYRIKNEQRLFCLNGQITHRLLPSQQTQNICIRFKQRRPNVFNVCPTLHKCYTNVLRLLGYAYIAVKL